MVIFGIPFEWETCKDPRLLRCMSFDPFISTACMHAWRLSSSYGLEFQERGHHEYRLNGWLQAATNNTTVMMVLSFFFLKHPLFLGWVLRGSLYTHRAHCRIHDFSWQFQLCSPAHTWWESWLSSQSSVILQSGGASANGSRWRRQQKRQNRNRLQGFLVPTSQNHLFA